MRKTFKAKKWLLFVFLVIAIFAIEAVLVIPLFRRGTSRPTVPMSAEQEPACRRVVSVLENNLKKIAENGEPADYLERAKILNRLSLEACGDDERRAYFTRAIAELQVADALRMLSAPMTDINQKVGFYWKERAEFYRMHGMYDREIEIYDQYLSVPGRGRDVYSLVKKAEALTGADRLNDAVTIYANIADICRTANNSNCYIAGAQFADLLEESTDSREMINILNSRWGKDFDTKDLFRFNGDAAARIRAVLNSVK